jgi:glycosyltransferase involved in cell wall biosynthesis
VLQFLLSTALRLARTGKHWDVVHFGDFVLFPLAWLHSNVAPNIARVITVHGLDLVYGERRGWKPWLYRKFIGWAQTRKHSIDRVIANSHNTAKLAERYGFHNCAVIPLGVRAPAQPPKPSPAQGASRYLLFIGRLVPRKGAAWLATQVLPHLPEDVSLKVVGSTWSPQEEKALAAAPKVERLGYVDDAQLRQLRAGAAAIVMPNIPSPDGGDVEGFGITALEAAISGTPLVAADLEGITDAVIDGVTGFLAPPLQPQAWAQQLRHLLAWTPEQRQAFAATAREATTNYYAWSRVAQDTLEVYASTRAGHPAHTPHTLEAKQCSAATPARHSEPRQPTAKST